MGRVLVWFSCGAASAVAAKLAVEKYPDCEILYCDTLAHEHEDNKRFMFDISKWIKKDIKILKSEKYTDIYDVFYKTRYLVGVGGARCSKELKKNVRKNYQVDSDVHIFGFSLDEKKRADRFEDNNNELIEWILIENNITKDDCYSILNRAGISLPEMYKLGYNNNNCIGCVKGGLGYWNKIRIDFPEVFNKMAKVERDLNVAINKTYAGDGKRKRVFLDELDPKAGRGVPIPNIDCGVICETSGSSRDQWDMLK